MIARRRASRARTRSCRSSRGADPRFEIPPTAPEDLALLHFTSGTTGRPKGAMHVHEAVVAHHATGRLALDLHDDDVFWCTADPGWVTGTSYGIVAPLTNGVTSIVDEAEFDAERWYRVLEDERVTVWYTAPTAVRMLMKAGAELARAVRPVAPALRRERGRAAQPRGGACGGRDALGLPIHDNWWQTETGGIMIANFAAMPVKPGSMGRPLPGVAAAIVQRDERGPRREVDGAPDVEGELALRPGWPSMFRGYLGDEERYRACFAGRLVPHRRPRAARRRRLLLVRRARGRRHQVGRPPHRAVRGGERAARAPGGRRGGRRSASPTRSRSRS